MSAGSLAVMTFHALDERTGPLSFPADVFRDGLRRLLDDGYRTMRLADAVGCLRQGVPFPDRAFVLTFDDGFRSIHETAFPLIAQSGSTATVFLLAGREAGENARFLDRTLLSWAEAREMHRAGIEFGAHTLTHPDLTRLSSQAAEMEMRSSKEAIEDALGAPVSSFAYPFGRWNAGVRELAARHFDCACSDTLGLIGSGSDPFALERVDAHYVRSKKGFGLLATGRLSWYLRARDVPRRLRRAVGGHPALYDA